MTRSASEARSVHASDAARASSASLRQHPPSRAEGPFDSLVDYPAPSDIAARPPGQTASPSKPQAADTGATAAAHDHDRTRSKAGNENGPRSQSRTGEPSASTPATVPQETSDKSSDSGKTATIDPKDKTGKATEADAKPADAGDTANTDSPVVADLNAGVAPSPMAGVVAVVPPPPAPLVSTASVADGTDAAGQPNTKIAATAGNRKIGTMSGGDFAVSQSEPDTDETGEAIDGSPAPAKGAGTPVTTTDNKPRRAQATTKGAAQAAVQNIAPDTAEAPASQNDGTAADPALGKPDASGKPNDAPATHRDAQVSAPAATPSSRHTATDKSNSDSASVKDANSLPANGGDPTAQSATATMSPTHAAASDQTAAPQDKSFTAAANLTVPVQGVAVAITVQAQAGNSRFAIRLDPPELGKIEVHLDMHNDGHVTSHLVVDHPETLDLLKRDAPALQRTLENAGFKTSDNGLQFSLRDHGGGSNQNHYQPDRSPRPSAPRVVSNNTGPAPVVSRHRLMASLRGGLDIQV